MVQCQKNPLRHAFGAVRIEQEAKRVYYAFTVPLVAVLTALTLAQNSGERHASETAVEAQDKFDSNRYLTGNWEGARLALEESGITFDIQWTQSCQGVVQGGSDSRWKYGGSLDFLTTLDLGKMDVLPGGYVRLLLEGRYGQSVNEAAERLLPVNTDLSFPLTTEPDENVIAITELSYTQFLSPRFGLILGKIQTLDGDPTEFANGRGQSQFMNLKFVGPNLLGVTIPYSTLAAGVLVLPTERISITSLLMNTTESSTTSGFNDIGDGTTWFTEGQFQYRLGTLPGGQNVGFAYAFDNEFLNFNATRFGSWLPKVATEDETWSIYWSAWQYLLTLDDPPEVIDAMDGRPDVRGLGAFARAGIVDEETNFYKWGFTAGLGGRGLIPSRPEDTFGIAGGYVEFSEQPVFDEPIDGDAYAFEAFYNAMLARGICEWRSKSVARGG